MIVKTAFHIVYANLKYNSIISEGFMPAGTLVCLSHLAKSQLQLHFPDITQITKNNQPVREMSSMLEPLSLFGVCQTTLSPSEISYSVKTVSEAFW